MQTSSIAMQRAPTFHPDSRPGEFVVPHTPFARDGVAPKNRVQELRLFSRDEQDALIAASNSLWWQAFIRLMTTSGLRVQEALRLHSTDVDRLTSSIRVTADPINTDASEGEVSLRQWIAPHRERVVPVRPEVMGAIELLRGERPEDSHVFVPDWKLDQLWPRITASERLTAEHLCPGIRVWFNMIQRRARLCLARKSGVRLVDLHWEPRGLSFLRETAIQELAGHMPPKELATLLGLASSRPLSNQLGSARQLTGGAR
jgi:integrase